MTTPDDLVDEMRVMLGPYADVKMINNFEHMNIVLSVAAKHAFFELKTKQLSLNKEISRKDKLALLVFMNECRRDDTKIVAEMTEQDMVFLEDKTRSIREFLEIDKDYLNTYYKLSLQVHALNMRAFKLYQEAIENSALDDKICIFPPHEWLWNQEAMVDSWNIFSMNYQTLSKNARRKYRVEKFNVYMRFMCENYPIALGRHERELFAKNKIIDLVDGFYVCQRNETQ